MSLKGILKLFIKGLVNTDWEIIAIDVTNDKVVFQRWEENEVSDNPPECVKSKDNQDQTVMEES